MQLYVYTYNLYIHIEWLIVVSNLKFCNVKYFTLDFYRTLTMLLGFSVILSYIYCFSVLVLCSPRLLSFSFCSYLILKFNIKLTKMQKQKRNISFILKYTIILPECLIMLGIDDDWFYIFYFLDWILKIYCFGLLLHSLPYCVFRNFTFKL